MSKLPEYLPSAKANEVMELHTSYKVKSYRYFGISWHKFINEQIISYICNTTGGLLLLVFSPSFQAGRMTKDEFVEGARTIASDRVLFLALSACLPTKYEGNV